MVLVVAAAVVVVGCCCCWLLLSLLVAFAVVGCCCCCCCCWCCCCCRRCCCCCCWYSNLICRAQFDISLGLRSWGPGTSAWGLCVFCFNVSCCGDMPAFFVTTKHVEWFSSQYVCVYLGLGLPGYHLDFLDALFLLYFLFSKNSTKTRCWPLEPSSDPVSEME